jgi:TBC1 domain family protein 5
MPENVYFRQPATQNILLDVLFVYCKLNPDVGYRQGMHELLAPILWVVERDAVESEERNSSGKDVALRTVFDSRYIEHDAFTIFGLVMQTAKTFYDPAADTRLQNTAGRSRGRAVENESAMLVRCRRIFKSILPRVDPALAAHLEELDITPQVFLM